MKKTRRVLKIYAKEALREKYGTAILGMVAVFGSNIASSMVTGKLFTGIDWISIISSVVFQFILTLIIGIFSAGLSYMYLNMARGREFSMGDLLYFFKNHPDRVIVAGFVMAVIEQIAFIPYYIVSFKYQLSLEATPDELLAWMSVNMAVMLLCIVLNEVLVLPFVLAYYLLADNLEMGGMEALKASMRMMKGNKGRYFVMQLSFVPLLFVSVFTFYIAWLWIIPYMEMTCVMFYRDLCGELDERTMQDPALPYGGNGKISYGTEEDVTSYGKEDTRRQDDFNSEA